MGGALDSAGGFLGLSDGPKAPKGNFDNAALMRLVDSGAIGEDAAYSGNLGKMLRGERSIEEVMTHAGGAGGGADAWLGALAANPVAGSRMATSEVQNNPLYAQMFGQGGLMSQYGDQLKQNMSQGLTPEDKTMYGQASGDIARQFGQSENRLSQNLASRGLSNSGAAGAMFSGLAGNQNEMLAKAQQDIMQQRFQNTMQQMGQMNQLAQTAGGLQQQQFGRQLAGAEHRQQGLTSAAGLTTQANQGQNAYQMQAADWEQKNKPANFMDYTVGGMGSSLYNVNAAPGTFAQSFAGGAGAGAGKAMGAGMVK